MFVPRLSLQLRNIIMISSRSSTTTSRRQLLLQRETTRISSSKTTFLGRRFYYSATPPRFQKDKDDDPSLDDETATVSKYITVNNTGLTEEEMDQIFWEEEEKERLEQESKFVSNWKPGQRKRPLRVGRSLEDFEYEFFPDKEPRWNLRDKRCGALATKLGMTAFFDEWGVRHPVTVLYLDENIVMGNKTQEKHGYDAVQVGAGRRKRKNVGVSVLGQYADVVGPEENPPYLVREFRVTDPELLIPVNARIHARHFVPGQNVDVAGISKGKGFQGPMKRHNFGGLPASHGVSKAHRAHGSTGQCQDPGRVFKGKKMAGRMGAERVTVQNLRVVKIDRGRNLLFIEGAVPGNKGEFVEVRDAVKKPLWRTEKVLGQVEKPPLPTFEYDEFDGSGNPGHEEIMPMPAKDPLLPQEDEAA